MVEKTDGELKKPFLLVKARRPDDAAEALCSWDPKQALLVVDRAWAYYFEGMRGRHLFIDSGTGTDRSPLIYDVDAKRLIYTGYSNGGFRLADGRLSYWTPFERIWNAYLCRGDRRLEHRVTVDLDTMRERRELAIRCHFWE